MALCERGFTGFWVCGLVQIRVRLAACLLAGALACRLTDRLPPPRSTRTLTPLSWWREGRKVFYSILFVTSFAKYVRFLLSNVVPKFVLRNPRRVVNKLGFPLVYPY